MLKKILLIYCQLLLVYGCSWGQQIFQKRYSVSGYNSTSFSSVVDYTDTTFVLRCQGYNNSQNATNVILEIDTSGNILWQKSYNFYTAYGCKNSDRTLSYTGDVNTDSIGYLKIDSVGNVITYLKIFTSNHRFVSNIIATRDSGNIILATNAFGNNFNEKEFGSVIKIDKNGNIQWVKHFGGTYQTFVNDAKEIAKGVYEIYGSSTSLESDTINYQNHNIFVLRLDSAGNQLSCHVIFEINKEYAWKYFIKANGNRLFALSSGKAGGGSNSLITFVETDSSFNTLWSKSYFDGVNFLSRMNDLINLSDTMFITTYNYFRFFDSNGNVVANPNIYGQYGSYKENVFYKNNSYYVFGVSSVPNQFKYYGIYFKINAALNSGCYQNSNGPNILTYNVPFLFQNTVINDTTVVYSITVDNLNLGAINFFFDTDCFGYTNLEEEATDENQSISVYPNPITSKFRVITSSKKIKDIFLSNTLGQRIKINYTHYNNSAEVTLPLELPVGIYLLKGVLEDGIIYNKKILKH